MKKTLKNTKDLTATDYSCEFCNRKFARERTVVSHICETKNRWLNKDQQTSRLAFQAFSVFYEKHTINKAPKTQLEFIKSPYYMAFIKFANYCINVKCTDIEKYIRYLLKNNIKIDNWDSDKNYTNFIIDNYKTQDPFDQVKNTIEYFIDVCSEENILHNDFLKYGNVNKICYAITTGRISPWVLYCSDSGLKFLDSLNQDHVKMVLDYINPEQYAIKMNREPIITNQIKQLLKDAGY